MDACRCLDCRIWGPEWNFNCPRRRRPAIKRYEVRARPLSGPDPLLMEYRCRCGSVTEMLCPRDAPLALRVVACPLCGFSKAIPHWGEYGTRGRDLVTN